LQIHNNEVSINSLAVIFHVCHAEIALQVHEEVLEVITTDLETVEIFRVPFPHKFEIRNIRFEAIQHIVIW
jgi:hypothetical protein